LEKHPAEVLDHGLVSGEGTYHIFRNGWGTDNDVVISVGIPSMYLGWGERGECGMGFSPKATTTDVVRGDDGSTVVTAAQQTPYGEVNAMSMAVDFSGLAGAPVLIVQAKLEKHRANLKADTEQERAFWTRVRQRQQEKQADQQKEFGGPSVTAPNEDFVWHRDHQLEVGGYSFLVRTMQLGGHAPTMRIVGEGDDQYLQIGRRTVRCDGSTLILGETE
jgi:hypothetical protein